MPNYFYADANGQKQGPVTEHELQELADQEIINPNTRLITDSGHKGLAGQIPGLKFNHSTPFSGGTKVGSIVNKIVETFESNPETTPLLSRFTFIILAAIPFTGMAGIHALYAKRNVMGLIHFLCMVPWILFFLFTVVTSFFGAIGIQIQVDWFSSSSMQADFMRGPDSAMRAVQRTLGWTYLLFFALPIISYLLALAEIVHVTKDGHGREFERF